VYFMSFMKQRINYYLLLHINIFLQCLSCWCMVRGRIPSNCNCYNSLDPPLSFFVISMRYGIESKINGLGRLAVLGQDLLKLRRRSEMAKTIRTQVTILKSGRGSSDKKLEKW
jgi:hypothetical protein